MTQIDFNLMLNASCPCKSRLQKALILDKQHANICYSCCNLVNTRWIKRAMIELGTKKFYPKQLALDTLVSCSTCPRIPMCSYTYAMKDTCSFTSKYTLNRIAESISGNIAIHRSHIATHLLKHNARLAVFPRTLLSHLATSHTDDHELFEWTKGHRCHCESLASSFP